MAKFKKPFSFYLGLFFMLFSVLVLFSIYFPLLNLYLNPPVIRDIGEVIDQGYTLTIPKINAQAPIFEGINPYVKTQYKPVLEKGIAQSQASVSLPNKGTVFLFAHSSDLPWRITKYNTAFLKLGDLDIADQIILTKNGSRYNYIVKEKRIVTSDDTKYLKKSDKNQLILQTCTPTGTALKRLLVFADPNF